MFFTNKLRLAIYQMPSTEKDAEFFRALKHLFYRLQFFSEPVGTHELTSSFGWQGNDMFEQEDIHEFCRLLFDKIETGMKGTPVEDTIPSLFKGRMRSFVRCFDVDFRSARDEDFYDLQLKVEEKADGRLVDYVLCLINISFQLFSV